jgi:hypothetical protein
LDECDLEDVGFIGDSFTWHRGAMRERLDRGLANQSWINLFDTAAIIHLEYNHSDHRPIMLDTEYYVPSPESINRSTRNFEAKWLKEEGFNDVVVQQWEAAQIGAIDVHERLRAMHGGLHVWDRTVLKGPKQTLRKAQRDLEILMRGPITSETDQQKHHLAKLIEKILEQEEIKWQQRSRANWLQNGDKNTGFFHRFASARKKKNHIKQLKDPTGQFVEGTELLNLMIVHYFTNLFSTDNPAIDPTFMEKVIPKVTLEMNDMLNAPFSADEVKKAVFSIGDLKAPGPDGFMLFFIKSSGTLLGRRLQWVSLKL